MIDKVSLNKQNLQVPGCGQSTTSKETSLEPKDKVTISSQDSSPQSETGGIKKVRPLFDKRSTLYADAITVGALTADAISTFTTDVALPLGMVTESAGAAVAKASLGLGSGAYRIVKGAIEIYQGIKNKIWIYKLQGALDTLIGATTITASTGVLPIPSLLAATTLMGVKAAFDGAFIGGEPSQGGSKPDSTSPPSTPPSESSKVGKVFEKFIQEKS